MYYIVPKLAALICSDYHLKRRRLQILQACDINFVPNLSRCITL